jgi:hypothetical protein
MDENQALERARQFARNRYEGEVKLIDRDHEKKLVEMRAQAAARGTIMSSGTVNETARIDAERIEALCLAKLDATLEGYDLHGVDVDDQMAITLCDQIIQGMNNLIHSTTNSLIPGMPAGSEALYKQFIAKHLSLSANSVKTEIDRKRFMAKKKTEAPSITTIYNVQGDNARWNTNSTDNSVNIVTKSSKEFFADLRGKIESEVPEGDERRKIVESLTALQASHGQPSFARRYTDFMAAAANHIKVIAPFIPALTEMLHHILK